ncbi:hypothetical protein HDU76_001459 [Blyttiomyces sp. JEL0837]|nr:hypothetical protein HDU76_001459 [Blyttiomyces sp. JEL0837]
MVAQDSAVDMQGPGLATPPPTSSTRTPDVKMSDDSLVLMQTAKNIIERGADRLGQTFEFVKVTRKIVDRISEKGYLDGKSPNTVASVSALLAATMFPDPERNLFMSKVAIAFNSGTASIKAALAIVKPHQDELLAAIKSNTYVVKKEENVNASRVNNGQ